MGSTRPESGCCGRTRRGFLADVGMGFAGLAMGAMLFRDGIARGTDDSSQHQPDGKPHFKPRAKSVIWLFMAGGVSHMEGFDPKPALNKYAGKTISATPFGDAVLKSPHLQNNLRVQFAGFEHHRPTIFPLQIGSKPRGKSGVLISDWWPHVGECVDDIAIVRSLWTTDNDHGAQLQWHTGRHILEGAHPTLGSWVHYGLGSLRDDVPQFVLLGEPLPDQVGGALGHGADYLGPAHAAVRLKVDPNHALPFASPGGTKFKQEQAGEAQLLAELHELTAARNPADAALRARIKSYELAFRMQTSVPKLMKFDAETPATRKLYGLDHATTKEFGEQCLAARRLVEHGVRFVQVFHGAANNAWDSHTGLKANHTSLCAKVDLPIAGLLKDLKQRGLMEETLVVWGTEFGRTPGTEKADGRDHHPFGFSGWLAGGGIKAGVVHGATDELGFHAVENRHYVTDIHATVLHQLGLDSRRLEIPGRKRLEIDHGKPIREIIA